MCACGTLRTTTKKHKHNAQRRNENMKETLRTLYTIIQARDDLRKKYLETAVISESAFCDLDTVLCDEMADIITEALS